MKLVRNFLVLVGTVVLAGLAPAAPAGANVSSSTSLTVPLAVSVGDNGRAGSFTTINMNTPPQNADTNTITGIQLAVGCAAAPAPPNPCPSPDLGVSSVVSPATGRAGTACAGLNFSVSAPDASGAVTFTPSGPVVLNPPGSAAGTDRCTVDFTFSVLKAPATDVQPGVGGAQTFINLRVASQSSPSGLAVANHPSQAITVNRAIPALSTQVSPRVQVGGQISDTATVTGVPGIATPTGTVTFNLFPPSDPTCAGAPAHTSMAALGGGVAQSTPFTANTAGFYRWVATYNGDANYISRTGTCGEPTETVEVTTDPPARPVADFDGNGTTDVAVFRPSTGQWFIRNGPTVQWAAGGDIPVPGDYNGDGATDVAVYRPSTGQWFVRNGLTVQWGADGDVPVPADYDGNGTADVAVYRPSTQQWFVRGGLTVQWGTTGDVPVPADYDGNGSDDVAVYRPSTGQWFVRNGLTVQWGAANDVPVPGDYDGDGATDVAVFRPSTGQFFVRNGVTVQWGVSTDVPLQLPNHIRRFFV